MFGLNKKIIKQNEELLKQNKDLRKEVEECKRLFYAEQKANTELLNTMVRAGICKDNFKKA